jgi:hypothetical protein
MTPGIRSQATIDRTPHADQLPFTRHDLRVMYTVVVTAVVIAVVAIAELNIPTTMAGSVCS